MMKTTTTPTSLVLGGKSYELYQKFCHDFICSNLFQQEKNLSLLEEVVDVSLLLFSPHPPTHSLTQLTNQPTNQQTNNQPRCQVGRQLWGLQKAVWGRIQQKPRTKNISWKGKHKKRKEKKKSHWNMQLNLQSKPNLRLKTGEKKSLSSFNTSDNKSLNPGRGIPWSSIKVSHEYVFNCSYGRRWVILMSLAPDQFQCKKKIECSCRMV